jgi:hypothetical protein
MKQIFNSVPASIMRFVPIFGLYIILNFIICINLLKAGGPEISNGKYVISSHGSVIREITFEDYKRYRAIEVRLFSGHWMAFLGISCVMMYIVGCEKIMNRMVNL